MYGMTAFRHTEDSANFGGIQVEKPQNAQLATYTSIDLINRVKAQARRDRRSISQTVALAMEEYLERNEPKAQNNDIQVS